jgi:hypothetical protein
MIVKYLAAAAALGAVVASTPVSAMPTSNLAGVAPSNTENVRYCRYRGCGRSYVRRYAPAYNGYYAAPYYNEYGPGYSYGGYGRYGGYGYGGPGVSLGFGLGGIGLGFGGASWGHHRSRW